MRNERGIALSYLRAQKKRTFLITFGVVLAIALVTTLFSVFEALVKFEVVLESESGIWHVAVQGCTSRQAEQISRRADVSGSGTIVSAPPATIDGGVKAALTGLGTGGAEQLNIVLKTGSFPKEDDEIALEQWVLRKIRPGVKLGDSLSVALADGQKKSFVLCGILKDNNQNRKTGYSSAAVSFSEAQRLAETDRVTVLMRVRGNVDINAFIRNIEKDQGLPASRVSEHKRLLAVEGRLGDNRTVGAIYAVAGFLALLVLFSAVVMIYNAFNTSVAQRVRQFGVLRAVGASPKQLRKVVKSEAALISLCGTLPGLLFGILVTSVLILFLKRFVPDYFPAEGPDWFISPAGLALGAVTGFLTTFLSSLLPARRAGKISPVEAMSDLRGNHIKKKQTRGIATRVMPAECALSLRQITVHKRSFVLTAVSLSFGILLLLCFSSLTDMVKAGTSQNNDYGDVSVSSKDGKTAYPDELLTDLLKVRGVDSVAGMRAGNVDATFRYGILGENYKNSVESKYYRSVKSGADGMIAAPEKSTLIGLADADINAMKSNLISGNADAAQLDREEGVILCINRMMEVDVSDLRPGDRIRINGRDVKICGMIRSNSLRYAFNGGPFLGIFTTNGVYRKFLDNGVNLVCVNFQNGDAGDAAVQSIKSLTAGYPGTRIEDHRENRRIGGEIALMGNVFIFGFIGVIALIGILNVVNTMSTNILVRTREIGLLRAGGMTMGQVGAMIVTEAALYGLSALLIGLGIGIPLERLFYNALVKQAFAIPWTLPWNLVLIASAVTLAAVLVSVAAPLKRIRNIVITQAVTVE